MFEFNGVSYTHADMVTEADRQANVAPSAITMTGGAVNETVSDGGSIAATYDPSGSAVATLTTVDANAGDSHSYALIADASGKFEIVGDEIRVRAGKTVDFETESSFTLTVRATDAFGETHDEVLTITVQDFEGSYTAGDGFEIINGTSEEDVLIGGAGINSMYGGAGDDVLDGGGGDDTLFASAGTDRLSGGDGADVFITYEDDGTAIIDGGADSDSLELNGATAGYSVSLTGDGAGTYASNAGTANGSFIDIEEVWGSSFGDTIDASVSLLGLSVHGMGGGDTIIGSGGSDRIFANSTEYWSERVVGRSRET